jgi:hypothetical protein
MMTNIPFRTALALLACVGATRSALAADNPPSPPVAADPATDFSGTADRALSAMKQRAEELHVKGVALVAYSPGDAVASWSSKMLVVGQMTKAPAGSDKGSNLLAIAYAKAAEMAATLKDSGTSGRPPMTGEFGWQGGVVLRGKSGLLIAAFSGGRSEDDVSVSKAGIAVLGAAL